MKIVVIGTRGIPGIQGGVETHCEELYPRIAAMGHEVTVICRTPYLSPGHPGEYRGVELKPVYAPKRKSLEAFVHTFLSLVKARRMNPDVVHIHAIGPSLLVPFGRLMGLRIVTTNHGPDYDRAKWGRFAKAVLRAGERMGARWSNRVIVISGVIARILATRYGRHDTCLIYNGVNRPEKTSRTDYLKSLGLEPHRYVVALGRLVREKGFHDLIEAWKHVAVPGFRLVIAGDADHPDEYSRSLKSDAASRGIIMTGFIKGEKLNQLMSHASLFVMPSYHEGLPIALLEAMSYGLDVAVSSIPANRIEALEQADFFPVGDIEAMAGVMTRKLSSPRRRSYDLSPYNWDVIARQTLEVYRLVCR